MLAKVRLSLRLVSRLLPPKASAQLSALVDVLALVNLLALVNVLIAPKVSA